MAPNMGAKTLIQLNQVSSNLKKLSENFVLLDNLLGSWEKCRNLGNIQILWKKHKFGEICCQNSVEKLGKSKR